jgi:hypothetical protein
VPAHPRPVEIAHVDIADDTFVVAAPDVVAAEVHRPAAWSRWWPALTPVVTRDRGVKGVQWAVTGALAGSMEIWLEPWGDGVLLHWYLRAAVVRPAGGGAGRAGVRRRGRVRRASEADRWVRAWKRAAFALKDRLEAGREPGSRRSAGPDPEGSRRLVKPAGLSADST